MSLQRYCFGHKQVVEKRHVALHTNCDVGDAFIARAGTGDVLMTEAQWIALSRELIRDDKITRLVADAMGDPEKEVPFRGILNIEEDR